LRCSDCLFGFDLTAGEALAIFARTAWPAHRIIGP
jgi:hypothetical protein